VSWDRSPFGRRDETGNGKTLSKFLRSVERRGKPKVQVSGLRCRGGDQAKSLGDTPALT
jgi:hypothetical protein